MPNQKCLGIFIFKIIFASMQHKYFISDGKAKEGPFTLEEILKKDLLDTTLVWRDGFDTWKNITEVEELKIAIVKSPPKLPLQKIKDKKREESTNTLISFLKVFALFGVGSFLLLYFLSGSWKSESQLRYEEHLTGDDMLHPVFGSLKDKLFNMVTIFSVLIGIVAGFIKLMVKGRNKDAVLESFVNANSSNVKNKIDSNLKTEFDGIV